LKLSSRPTASSAENSHFDVDHLSVGLKRRSVRGAALTFSSQSLKFLVQLAGTAVLGRLLTPQDYGLIGMVTAVTGVLTVFGTFGLSGAIVQEPHINQRQMSTLFWLNAALGFGLALLTAAMAPLLAWLFHDSRLAAVTIALGCGFPIAGLGVQHAALLRRQMRFGTLAVIEILSCVVAAVAGIVMAWLRFGYWSLAVMQLTLTVLLSVGAWIACNWRPGKFYRGCGIRSMVAFGGNLTVFNIVNYWARNLDNVLIGWRWGPESLGQYSKAYNLLLFPILQVNAPMSNVAVPALSRLQNDPIHYRNYFLRALNLVAYVTLPLIIGLSVFSREIIVILLGPQWLQASVIFRILSVSAILQPILNTTGWLFTSLNRTGVLARLGFITSICYAFAFVLGLRWGAPGVATAYSLITWLIAYPAFAVAVRGTPVSMKDVASAIHRPFAVAIMFGATLMMCRFALSLTGFGVAWVLVFAALSGVTMIFAIRHFWAAARADFDGIIAMVQLISGPNRMMKKIFG
jgi:O-antigen/teichoic acid export membrane protein